MKNSKAQLAFDLLTYTAIGAAVVFVAKLVKKL
jgi:hypothetical protein